MKTVKINGMTIKMDVTSYIKWENRAKRLGVPVSKLLSDTINAS